ncbi:MAG: phage holin family protein [Cyanobacteria bacterium P01_G01_bin.49]
MQNINKNELIGYLLTILATALGLLVVDILFPGVNLSNILSALIAGAVIGAINSTVKPVLSTLSLPLNVLSLGLFSLVINGVCFWLASVVVPGFRVAGLLSFLLAPVILSAVNTFLLNYFTAKYPTALDTQATE